MHLVCKREVLRMLSKNCDTNEEFKLLMKKLNELPVTEKNYGTWIPQDDSLTKFMCSVCNSKNHQGYEKFCPECGADMRKKV